MIERPFPEKIKIGGHDYQVLRVKKFPKRVRKGQLQLGYADFDKQVIYVYEKVTPSKGLEILLHEILHVLEAEIYPKLKLRESQVEELASGLFAVLNTNGFLPTFTFKPKKSLGQFGSGIPADGKISPIKPKKSIGEFGSSSTNAKT